MPFYVYILTNKSNTLYVGSTNNLERRLKEHFHKHSFFTSKYNINKLVYYQQFQSPQEAISAERKIKGWTRKKKIELIKTINPQFKNLLNGI